MDIERERGITIKAQTVRLNYRADDGKDYVLNLIDTPGHVDFAYEVSRARSPPARARSWSSMPARASRRRRSPTSTRRSTTTTRSCRSSTRSTCPPPSPTGPPADRGRHRPRRLRTPILISAKTGLGIHEVLEAIVTRLPAAQGRPTRAAEGAARRRLVRRLPRRRRAGARRRRRLKKGQRIRMMGTGAAYDVDRVGVFTPKLVDRRARPGRDRLHHRLDQGGRRHPRRRHHHRRPQARPRDAARLPAGAAGGLLRPLPGRRRRLRGPARRHGQAPPQRRQLHLRDGDQRRPRLRLPLRLPRPPAPGDHPGAAEARVQPRPDRDRALASSTRSP